jgi:hypothetical protein
VLSVSLSRAELERRAVEAHELLGERPPIANPGLHKGSIVEPRSQPIQSWFSTLPLAYRTPSQPTTIATIPAAPA